MKRPKQFKIMESICDRIVFFEAKKQLQEKNNFNYYYERNKMALEEVYTNKKKIKEKGGGYEKSEQKRFRIILCFDISLSHRAFFIEENAKI